MVRREMDNIERFVGGLLRYSRTQALHLKPVDLGSLMDEIAGEAGLVSGSGVTFRVEGDPVTVRVDEEQLRQAVRNLVLNAVDVSETGSAVVLRTGWDGDGAPWIEVEDEGPGIPPEQRTRVLEPFFTSKAGGTGLGLAIVARIVEDHEGSLQVLEGARGGARFRIVLNRMEAHREAAAHAA
jgi:signal transduction histidine kinase